MENTEYFRVHGVREKEKIRILCVHMYLTRFLQGNELSEHFQHFPFQTPPWSVQCGMSLIKLDYFGNHLLLNIKFDPF